MKELLFDSIIEKEALENILALNQIKKCDNEIEKYTKEINEQNEEMMRILKDEDINENYIEKIYKYKNLLNNIDGDNGRISELENIIQENEVRINEFQDKIIEIENRLEELKREIFETDDPSRVIDCQNEIENSNVRLNDLNEILNGLISDNTPLLIEKEYLIAKNNDFDFNVPNYNKNEISNDLNKLIEEFNEEIEKLDLPIRENIEFCQKKIQNREIEICKLTERKNKVIETYPNSVGLNVENAYSEIENLLCELELKRGTTVIPETNIFDDEDFEEVSFETEEIEVPVEENVSEESLVEETDLKDEMVGLNDENEETIVNTENQAEVLSEPVLEEPETPIEENVTEETIVEETVQSEEIKEEKVEDSSENEEIGSVSYVLSDGESMMNIAEKVYPSKDNWEAIYYFNKDAIDKYLVSNGISNDFDTVKELASDTSLFTGIQLEIPTDYNYKI